jgi:prevent-host-death family protein
MKTVSVSEAKAKLSALLKRVARGETVLICSRGHPVARLTRSQPADAGSDEERLARLEAAGIIKRGRKPATLDFLTLPAPELDEEHSLLRALLEEREEGR